MLIAVPVAGGRLTPHFGRCEEFALVEVEPESRTVGEVRLETPPPHAPGTLPQWLVEQGVDLVLAGGMGPAARQMLEAAGVQVILGLAPAEPAELARAWLADELALGDNACDH